MVDEHVLAAISGGDEPIPLRIVEPLHGSGCHTNTSSTTKERAEAARRCATGTRSASTQHRSSVIASPLLTGPITRVHLRRPYSAATTSGRCCAQPFRDALKPPEIHAGARSLGRGMASLDHCVIAVSDWQRSNEFYAAVLDAE